MGSYGQITLNYEDLKKLLKKFQQLPKNAEYEINNYLWNGGAEIFQNEIISKMPRSNKDKTVYKKGPKVHARDINSLDKITYNLGIKIQTKLSPKSSDFGYLIFPDEGRGKHQRRAQKFFQGALDKKGDEVSNKLIEHLNKKIEEDLK